MAHSPPGTRHLPRGETLCSYGKYGRPGRALRDAEQVLMNRLAAAVVWLFLTTVVTTVYVVATSSQKEGDFDKVLTVAAGVALGTLLATGVVWLYGLTPHAERSHWHTGHEVVTFGGHVRHFLLNRHWHRTVDLHCEMIDPKGQKYGPIQACWRRDESIFYAPNEKIAEIPPEIFKAPMDLRGRYQLRWTIGVDGRNKPIVLATERWRQVPRKRPSVHLRRM